MSSYLRGLGLGLALLAAVGYLAATAPGDIAPRVEGDAKASTPLATAPALRGREQDASANAPPRAASQPTVLTVEGLVQDETYRPAAGATVTLTVAGADVGTVRTDSTGSFRLPLDAPSVRTHANLRAAFGSTGATLPVPLHPASRGAIDAGTLLLQRAHRVEVRVAHKGRPVAGADVFASTHPRGMPSGEIHGHQGVPWRGWSHAATTDARGLAVLEHVPEGDVRILAVRRDAPPLRGEARVGPASLERAVHVALEPARDVRVRVVDAADGSPLPGCDLILLRPSTTLWDDPFPLAPTDAAGESVVPCLPRRAPVTVNVAGDGFVHPYGSPHHEGDLPHDVEALTIEVPEAVAVRMPVTYRDGDAAPDGTPVRIESAPGNWGTIHGQAPSEGVIEGGHLVLRARSSFGRRGVAVLPDGRSAVFPVRRGSPIVFARGHDLSVRVIDPRTGEPLTRAAVGVGSMTNAAPFLHRAQPTDAHGIAHFHAIPADVVTVHVTPDRDRVPPPRWGRIEPGTDVDLRAVGAALLELPALPEIEATILVRVSGRPEVPAGLRVFAWTVSGQDASLPVPRLDVEAATATVRFSVRRRPPSLDSRVSGLADLGVVLAAPGLATEWAALSWRHDEDAIHGVVDLVRATSVTADVAGPDGLPLPVHLRRVEDGGEWEASPVLNDRPMNTFENLRPGTYRWSLDGELFSPPFELGATPRVVAWDLRASGWVRGRVDLPEGLDLTELNILVDGDPAHTYVARRRHDETRFAVRVPDARPITLRATHPSCRDDDAESRATVQTPRDDVVLTLRAR